MAESSSNRHGKVCAAAVLALSGLIIGACEAAPGGPAPVYMMGMAGTAIADPAAAAPTEPSMAPVALASWTEPSGSVGHTASDVIPLDDPPQPAPAPARQVTGPAATGANAPAPAAAPSAPVASAAPAAAPAPAAALPPAVSAPAAPPVAASVEPSAAEAARAEAAPPPVRERTASEPTRADLVTAGAGMPRPAPYSRPSYYWP